MRCNIYFFYFLLSLPFSSFAQKWIWVKASPGSLQTSVVQDKWKNVYTGNTSLSKYDSIGTFNWTIPVPLITGITSDTIGNIYTCGNSLCRYSPAGFTDWSIPTPNASWTGIKVDLFKNIYICGYSLTQAIGGFFHLSKYDSLGTLYWSKVVYSKGGAVPLGLDVDKLGNCYIAGEFRDSVTFDGTTIYSNGGSISSIFYGKFDPNGTILWAISEGNNFDRAAAISLDHQGNFYSTGEYKSPSLFGTTTLTNSASTRAMFVSKYDTAGNHIWSATGSSGTVGKKIWADSAGCIVACGSRTMASFYGVNGGNISYSNTSYAGESFVIRYNNNGDLDWGLASSGTNQRDCFPTDLFCDQDNCYITGLANGLTYFDNSQLNIANTTIYYGYLAKISTHDKLATFQKENEKRQIISLIYPNPSKDEINLQLSHYAVNETSTKITILNLAGQNIYSKDFSNNINSKFTINVSNFASGMYFIEVAQGSEKCLQKFVIQH